MTKKAVTKRELINQIEQLQEVTRITLNESRRRGQRDYQPNGKDGMSLPVAHLEDMVRESEDILNRIRVERELNPHANIPTIDANGVYFLDTSQRIADGVKFLTEQLPKFITIAESKKVAGYHRIVEWTGDSKAPTITTLMDGMSLNRARMVVKLYESSDEFKAMKNPPADSEILDALEEAQKTITTLIPTNWEDTPEFHRKNPMHKGHIDSYVKIKKAINQIKSK